MKRTSAVLTVSLALVALGGTRSSSADAQRVSAVARVLSHDLRGAVSTQTITVDGTATAVSLNPIDESLPPQFSGHADVHAFPSIFDLDSRPVLVGVPVIVGRSRLTDPHTGERYTLVGSDSFTRRVESLPAQVVGTVSFVLLPVPRPNSVGKLGSPGRVLVTLVLSIDKRGIVRESNGFFTTTKP